MPRARKQTVDAVVVTPEVKVPEVLITRQQYIEDIKVRWQIHQYEVNKLREDVTKFTQTVAPYVKQSVDYLTEKYQQLIARRVAV
jgi:acyl CoA:acetate/3-ketoacid CoA transferase